MSDNLRVVTSVVTWLYRRLAMHLAATAEFLESWIESSLSLPKDMIGGRSAAAIRADALNTGNGKETTGGV